MQNCSGRRMKSFQNVRTKKYAETCFLALEMSAVCKDCKEQRRRGAAAGVRRRELTQVKGIPTVHPAWFQHSLQTKNGNPANQCLKRSLLQICHQAKFAPQPGQRTYGRLTGA